MEIPNDRFDALPVEVRLAIALNLYAQAAIAYPELQDEIRRIIQIYQSVARRKQDIKTLRIAATVPNRAHEKIRLILGNKDKYPSGLFYVFAAFTQATPTEDEEFDRLDFEHINESVKHLKLTNIYADLPIRGKNEILGLVTKACIEVGVSKRNEEVVEELIETCHNELSAHPSTSVSVNGIQVQIEVPDDISDEELKERIIGLSQSLNKMHRDLGGKGLKIRNFEEVRTFQPKGGVVV